MSELTKIARILIISVLIPCLPLLSACNTRLKSSLPSIKIQGDFRWKHIDTDQLRVYYYQDDDFVKSKSKEIDNIYNEICSKLKHKAKPDPNENNKTVIYFLDDNTYKNYTRDTVAGAGWRKEGVFINLSKKDSPSINGTLRHELIHAVTMSYEYTILNSCPGWFLDGIAQYFQQDINKGSYSISIIKEALAKNEIVPWSELNPRSGSWGSDKRPLKYYESACIYGFLTEHYGEEKINSMYFTNGDFSEVIQGVTGKTVNELEKDWLDYISIK